MKIFMKKRRFRAVIWAVTTFLTVFGVLKLIDSRVVPAAEEAALIYSSDFINQKIDETASKIISDKNITYSDFYNIKENEKGISSIIINSLLVNEICSAAAADLSAALSGGKTEKIPVSLGLITGFKILSGLGPEINVRLVPMGSVKADYETALTDSGINSVNFKVFLNINVSVKIISPLCRKPLEITRKYMLADVVFTGAVPDTYLRRQ